jgi:hypothetical protein
MGIFNLLGKSVCSHRTVNVSDVTVEAVVIVSAGTLPIDAETLFDNVSIPLLERLCA